MDSYVRRTTWAHHNQAVQVISLYAEAMSGGSKGKGQAQSSGEGVQVAPDALFELMGAKVVYAT